MHCYIQHAAQEQNVQLLFAEPIEDFWEVREGLVSLILYVVVAHLTGAWSVD